MNAFSCISSHIFVVQNLLSATADYCTKLKTKILLLGTISKSLFQSSMYQYIFFFLHTFSFIATQETYRRP